ncbi:hypothetical protein C8J57DRAFT_1269494 [Mycena rebaudengoi]|nr:hypothetical protein C8J57DRAFT_1269494 [Mycena rebaudengoi]
MALTARPLEAHVVLTILDYISPTVQQLPQHLISSQLALRHSCLKLSPDDTSYLFWPSSADQQIVNSIESFQQRPVDDVLEFPIQYTADDSLYAHVQLAPAGLRLDFQWEEGTWKYNNAACMPFPPRSSASLHDLPEMPKSSGDSSEETADSYWDSYGEPERDGAAAHVEQEEPTNGSSYWDMYSSVHGSGDSALPSPEPEKQRFIPFSYAEIHPTTVHNPLDSLSERLEALSHRTIEETVLEGDQPDVDALKESLRGVFRLWKASRPACGTADEELFLSVVREVVAEQNDT